MKPAKDFFVDVIRLSALLCVFHVVLPGNALGQSAPLQISSTASFSQQPASQATLSGTSNRTPYKFPVQIQEQHQQSGANGAVIFNRIAPPYLPQLPPTPPQVPTADQLQQDARRANKKDAVLVLSAMVFDRLITAIRWGENHKYLAYSNIDFNLLGIGDFETEDTVYRLFMAIGNETAANCALVDSKFSLPPLSAFNADKAEYILDKASPGPPPEALVGILDSDVPSTITFAQVLPSNQANKFPIHPGTDPAMPWYAGLPHLSFNQFKQATVRDKYEDYLYTGTGGLVCQIPYDPQRRRFFTKVADGDSGSPVFLIVNNQPVLVTCWYSYGPDKGGVGPDYSFYFDRINAAMTNLSNQVNAGTYYQLTPVDLSMFSTY